MSKSRFYPILIVVFSFVLGLALIEIKYWSSLFFLCLTLLLLLISFMSSKDDLYKLLNLVIILSLFVSPLFLFFDDEWMTSYIIKTPSDWSPWALRLSLINFVGVILFLLFSRKASLKMNVKSKYIYVESKNTILVLQLLMLISFSVQTYIYVSLGGILSYMDIYTQKVMGEGGGFEGFGLLFLISESFPMLYLIYFFVKNRFKNLTNRKLLIFLLLLFIFSIYFGGLRGSRSNTIFTLFSGLYLIHVLFKSLSLKHFIFSIFLFFSLMIVGKTYKTFGTNISNTSPKAIMDDATNDVKNILKNDLSRFEMNSLQLFLLSNDNNFRPAFGQTYVWAVFNFLPLTGTLNDYFNIKDRGTISNELLYSSSKFGLGDNFVNSRVYGLLGEYLLNFSIYTFFIPFIAFGLIINLIFSYLKRIRKIDFLFILLPVAATIVPNLFLSDMNNIMYIIIKKLYPILILFFTLKKIKFHDTLFHNRGKIS